MKKAIVLEVKRKYAIAMTEDKKLIRLIKKPDMNANQIVHYFIEDCYAGGSTKASEKIHFFRLAIAFACVLLFLLVSITNLNGPIDRAYAMVTFDVNPSLEIFINDQEEVKYIEALNEEGKKLVKGYSVKKHSLGEVLDYLTRASARLGYLSDQGIVLVSYTALEGQVDITIPTMDNYIHQYQDKYTLAYARPSEEEAKEAQNQGLSVGKYILIKQSKTDIDEKDKKELKVSELIESTNDRVKIYPAENKPEKADNPNKPEEPGQSEKIDNPNKPEEPGQPEKIDNPNRPVKEEEDQDQDEDLPADKEKIDNPNKPEEPGPPDKIDNPNKPVKEEKKQQDQDENLPTDDEKMDNPNKPELPADKEKIDNPNKPEEVGPPDKIDNPNKPVKEEEDQDQEENLPADKEKIDNPNKPDKPEKSDKKS